MADEHKDQQQTGEGAGDFTDETLQTFLRDRGIDIKLKKDKVVEALAKKLQQSERDSANLQITLNTTKGDLNQTKGELNQTKGDLNQAKVDLADANDKYDELQGDKTTLETELSNTKVLLIEASTVNEQLSAKLRAAASAVDSKEPEQKKVLTLLGGYGKDIYIHLDKKDAKWKKLDDVVSIEKLEEIVNNAELLIQMSGYHKILLCLGSVDIDQMSNTTSSLSLAKRYLDLLGNLRETLGSEIMVLKLPPAEHTLKMSDVVVFNDTLVSSEGIEVIECAELRKTVRSRLYNDGSLTELAAKIMAKAINDNLTLNDVDLTPSDMIMKLVDEKMSVKLRDHAAASGSGYSDKQSKQKAVVVDVVEEDVENPISDFVPAERDKWGCIIGKKGRNLTELQYTTGTVIKMFKYFKHPVSSEILPVAFIKGKSLEMVNLAKQMIKAKLEAEKRKVDSMVSSGVSPNPKRTKPEAK